MRYLLPAVLGALSLIYVDGVAAQDVPTCVPGCADTVKGQFPQYGCVSADDAACLCANANFGFGVRDCGQSGCGATDVQIQAFLAGSFCQGQQLAFTPTDAQAPPTSTSAGPPSSTAPPGETTPIPTSPSSTTAPNSETAPPSSSSTTAPPTTTAPPSTAPPTQTSAPLTATPPHQNSTIPVSTPTSPPSTTTSVASSTSAATTSSPTASETSAAAPAGGLSQGAAIGIGVGVAGGVIAIALVGAFFFLKNRSRTHDSFDISQPPPSSGRGQGAFEKYSNDLELVSNRYEDMIPRQQPRAMV
ncbi:uncharacterized protein TRIVIDRAFT_61772 [Trichoderma virens Gv29-8]|uniref:CFEM domain-containing protein n=1 Tax=Hypocrea virens (strain Gv29-8 / FGSC 10586) TaxID=413071 RepID=G9MLJ1_HYPVG|nr:uncharacterized protein TRIVIDRAFT_61772 [Trichoderma virens Gv29-8]EHK25064.1 hypothetical protein TRIVIDRAFT_61772 [Trichoderma virens Gv29-8]